MSKPLYTRPLTAFDLFLSRHPNGLPTPGPDLRANLIMGRDWLRRIHGDLERISRKPFYMQLDASDEEACAAAAESAQGVARFLAKLDDLEEIDRSDEELRAIAAELAEEMGRIAGELEEVLGPEPELPAD